MTTPIQIRAELAPDVRAVRRVIESAFSTEAEARLVDQLRARGKAVVSLVAAAGREIRGSIVFSPVRIEGRMLSRLALGLAPVAVLPEHQRQGIGSQLVRAGLDACRGLQAGFVVVLGDPAYYARFGFVPASRFRLQNEFSAGDAFQVLELISGAIPPGGGLVMYAPEFVEV
jgi:putative acetyltransferase